jgi:hypothetical protein
MKLGAERNKVIMLAALSMIAAGTIYVQYFSGPPTAPPRAPRPTAADAAAAPATAVQRAPRARPARSRSQRFQPSFSGGSEEPLDPMQVDPTLRTDLLAKVRAVEFTRVERDLFQFTTRKVEPLKPAQVAKAQELLKKAEEPKPPPAAEPPPPSKPKAPPIPWKYYGFATPPGDTRKRAFLLDGEDVLIATEGDVFKNRYKVVRIGVNSIIVEDLQFQDQQTLPLDQS